MSKLIYVTLFMLISALNANAAVYKGQKVYVKECKKCHGTGQKIAKLMTKREWKRVLADGGMGLAQMHIKSKKAKKSWRYFKSAKYLKRARHLKDFLVEYAKDSGKVPACND